MCVCVIDRVVVTEHGLVARHALITPYIAGSGAEVLARHALITPYIAGSGAEVFSDALCVVTNCSLHGVTVKHST